MNLDVDIYYKQGRFLLDAEFRCFESALGIYGPSGSGKSTLFRAISGLIQPHGGRIALDGEALFDAARRIHTPPHLRRIGVVFQDARLFPHWSVEQNLRAGEFRKKRIANRPYSFDDIIELLNISPFFKRSTEQLSGGEKQRVAIGRTLLSNPRLLLMDEPVNGLDATLKQQILPFMAEIHRNLKIPTLFISHSMDEILQLTDQLLMLHEGRVTAYGNRKALTDSGKLSE